MKRALLLVGTLMTLGMNVQAQDFDFFETVWKCEEIVENLDYQEAYAKGKFHPKLSRQH